MLYLDHNLSRLYFGQHPNLHPRTTHPRLQNLRRRRLFEYEVQFQDIPAHLPDSHPHRKVRHRNQRFRYIQVTKIYTSNHYHHDRWYTLLQYRLPKLQSHYHKHRHKKLHSHYIHMLCLDRNLIQLYRCIRHCRHHKYMRQSSQNIHHHHQVHLLRSFDIDKY